ncbi:MAG: sialate O-acetylesterase, partial [Pedobacter sp.]
AEDWTSTASLEAHPELKFFAAHYDSIAATSWQPKGQTMSGLYNGMIHPLLPFSIAGIAWYQGEANNVRAYQYAVVLENMINNWRKDFEQDDLPFLIVQIAPHKDMSPELREAQLQVSKQVKRCALIITTDCGDSLDIHPAWKQPVGARLALAARAVAYQEKITYSGPELKSYKVKGGYLILNFASGGSGLSTNDGQPVKGFEIAGADGQFVPANVKLRKRKVIVYNPTVPRPGAVRYGWANVPNVNLCNSEGLPASPFRTDHTDPGIQLRNTSLIQ